MPFLVGHPARGPGAETQHRAGPRPAGEYAVAAGQKFVQLVLVDVHGVFVKPFGGVDAVHGEDPERVPVMIPGVEIPVVAVVHQSLRRNRPAAFLVRGAAVVAEAEPAPLQERRGQGRENLGGRHASRRRHHAHAAPQLPADEARRLEQFFDAFLERRKEGVEQAGLYAVEQLLAGEQGVQFGGGEPETRQFIGAAVGAAAHAIAVVFPAVFNGRAQMQTHVPDDADDGRPRAFEGFREAATGYRHSRVGELLVQGIYAVKPVHGLPLRHVHFFPAGLMVTPEFARIIKILTFTNAPSPPPSPARGEGENTAHRRGKGGTLEVQPEMKEEREKIPRIGAARGHPVPALSRMGRGWKCHLTLALLRRACPECS